MNKTRNEITNILIKWGIFYVYTLLLSFNFITIDLIKPFNLDIYIKEGSFNELSSILVSFFYTVIYISYMLYLLWDLFKKSNATYVDIAKKIMIYYLWISAGVYLLLTAFDMFGYEHNNLMLFPSYGDVVVFKFSNIAAFLLAIVFANYKGFTEKKSYLKKAIPLSLFMWTILLSSVMNINISGINEYNKVFAVTRGQDNYNAQNVGFIYYPIVKKDTNLLSGDIVDVIYYINNKPQTTEKDIFNIIENYYKNYESKSDFIKDNFESVYKGSRVNQNEIILEKYKDKDLALIEYYKKEGLDKTLEKIKTENYQSIIPMLLNQRKNQS
jgi:hypothetical protein